VSTWVFQHGTQMRAGGVFGRGFPPQGLGTPQRGRNLLLRSIALDFEVSVEAILTRAAGGSEANRPLI